MKAKKMGKRLLKQVGQLVNEVTACCVDAETNLCNLEDDPKSEEDIDFLINNLGRAERRATDARELIENFLQEWEDSNAS